MKSRTSFFDKTVLKKDLLRFSPLWALYLIGGLLIMHTVSSFNGSYYGAFDYSLAQDLNVVIGPLGILSGIYAFLVSQLLFGDLHAPRLCYGVHAMPLRREGWYLTHLTSGVLMGLVPPLVIVLTLMPYLGRFWYVGLLCWGGMALHYLFFFGLATFCMMCTGNRFAATAIYGILNFLALIVYWFVETIYLPMLSGVRVNTGNFDLFCPVVELVSRQDFFLVTHLETCPCHKYSTIYYDFIHDFGFTGLGGDWGYLWILAGAGVALLALGLLLYRIRHLERAGDFMVFKPMKPIFLWVYSMCAGAALFFFGENFGDEATGYFFFVIGIFIGYFTGKMLLERTIRVFKGKSWAGLGIVYAAVALSLLLTWIDPIGITRRVPDSQRVKAVYLYDGYLSDYQLNNSNRLPGRGDVLVVTDPEDIDEIRDIHRIMIEENKHQTNHSSRWFTLQYKMKNGATVSRTYRIYYYGEAWNGLREYMTKPAYLFGAGTLEQLQQQTTYMHFSEVGEVPENMRSSLLKAMWLDAHEGTVSSNGSYVDGKNVMSIDFQTKSGYHSLYFTAEAKHLNAWLQENKCSPQLMLKYPTAEKLIANTDSIYSYQKGQQLPASAHSEFLTLLWQDCQNGLVDAVNKWSNGTILEVSTGEYLLSLALSSDSQCAQWLSAHFGK